MGAFFVLNLMIAAQIQFLNESFEEVKEQNEKDRKKAEAAEKDDLMQQS